jgi:opacity protein-like surface antigen
LEKEDRMKKLSFLIVLLLPLISSAQISLGVTAGANIGKFGGVEPPDASYASRTGINFGGTIAYRFNKDISLTFQPMYSQRGTNVEVGEDTRRDSMEVYETKLDFLIIPIFVRVDSDNGVTYFISGLEFGIPLSAEVSHDGGSRDISEKLKNIDILASIGMGLRFSLGKPDLLIEFRYYQGLVNFNSGNGEEDGNIIFEDFKNSGFQLMAGLEWEL